jgi:hypothetical protein
MNRLAGNNAFLRTAANLALAVIVAGSALLVSGAPALAAGDEAPPVQNGLDERPTIRLEFAYLRLQHAAEGLALHLDHAGEVADFIEEWIETLRDQGQNVSELEGALEAFEAALDEAQGFYEQAADVLNEHAGFDGNGKVSDRGQAVETVREAGRSLRDGRRALKEGVVDLRRAIRDWRRDHRPRPAGA